MYNIRPILSFYDTTNDVLINELRVIRNHTVIKRTKPEH